MSLLAEQPMLPPEELVDADNPLNDRYHRNLEALQRAAVVKSRQMRARYVAVARGIHADETPKDIADRLKIRLATVYSIRKRQDVQDLLDILRHLAALIEGPNLALRKHMLWRIARANEDGEPNVTIQAVKELNKIDGAYPVQAIQPPATVNVTINQEAMPRTALDGEPA